MLSLKEATFPNLLSGHLSLWIHIAALSSLSDQHGRLEGPPFPLPQPQAEAEGMSLSPERLVNRRVGAETRAVTRSGRNEKCA